MHIVVNMFPVVIFINLISAFIVRFFSKFPFQLLCDDTVYSDYAFISCGGKESSSPSKCVVHVMAAAVMTAAYLSR